MGYEILAVELGGISSKIELNFGLLMFLDIDQFFSKDSNTYPLVFVFFNRNVQKRC